MLQGSGVQSRSAIDRDPEIAGVAFDSRRVEPGDLFLAIPGMRSDGARFVDEAIRRGARAIVAAVPRPTDVDHEIAWVEVASPRETAGPLAREHYGRPDEALALVGITGTNGKTTVAHLVESIGRAAGRKSGRIGTVGYSLDGEEHSLERTTPEAPDLYQLLGRMRDLSIELVALEVSSHALTLSRVGGARFSVAAFLNLSHDHLDFHGDLEKYFEAKATLFTSLARERVAVLPADSPRGRELAQRTSARIISFGRTAAADVRLTSERCGLDGATAVIETPQGRLPVRTRLLGDYNLDNVAAAAACALALELPAEAIPAGVAALGGVPGRMERICAGGPLDVVVDYAHTPAALERVLAWAKHVTSGQVRVVFGCGGGRDADKRPEMGRVAARLADTVYLTSDNPRAEDPETILDGIERGVVSVSGATERYRRVVDREQAIRRALTEASSGDVIVIAGKGHETVQIVGDRSRPFDDREIARRALADADHEGEAGACR